jgi:exodeoxyribonuclease III
VKIATFNINNVNKRLPNLLAWLKSSKPDIVCLQELKADQADFPEDALRKAGYSAAWVGQRTWNGVAILSRRSEIVVARRKLPGDAEDAQSRYLKAVIDGIIVVCLYAPNGNPRPGPKFDYKLAWLRRLNRHAAALRKTGAPVALVGDFNVVPTADDIYPTKSWDKDALVRPEARKLSRHCSPRDGRTRFVKCIPTRHRTPFGHTGAAGSSGMRDCALIRTPSRRQIRLARHSPSHRKTSTGRNRRRITCRTIPKIKSGNMPTRCGRRPGCRMAGTRNSGIKRRANWKLTNRVTSLSRPKKTRSRCQSESASGSRHKAFDLNGDITRRVCEWPISLLRHFH